MIPENISIAPLTEGPIGVDFLAVANGRRNALLDAMISAGGESHLRVPAPIFLPHGRNPFQELPSEKFVIYPISAVVAVSVLTIDGGLSGAAMVGWDASLGMASSPNSPVCYSYQTLQAGYAVPVPISAVLESLKIPAVSRVMLDYLAFVIKALSTIPHCVARHSAESRVARWIGSVYMRSPLTAITVTHEFLGNYLCMRRESVTEALSRLACSGAIETGRASIIVKDPQSLIEKSCTCSIADKSWLSRWNTNSVSSE